jgi:predicted hydrolase (HD superfamily)
MTAQYPRVSLAAKALYACDELAGFIVACARLRPTGLGDLTASNVRKKMKVKSFARGVNRDDIVRGAADFQVDLDEHIQFVIDALKPISLDLGLTSLPGDSSVSSPQSEDNLDPQG